LFWWWKSGPLKGGRAMRSGNWKLYQEPGDQPTPVQLFDLAADPQEKMDLAAKFPERVTSLKQVFDTWAAGVEADAAQPPGAKESTKP
jgi:arylsulfatase